MARDDEIWVHPPARGSELPPAWRDALLPRLTGIAGIVLLGWGVVEFALHVRLAGG